MELAAAGCPIQTHPADVTKVGDMNELARVTRERLGEIDALVFVTGDNTPTAV